MKKFLDKFYQITEKIGKQNVILLIFIFIVLIVTGLYQTFSLYTESNGVSILDGIKTLQFILNEDPEETSVTIASGSSKNIAITVTNQEKINLQYGIYYSSSDDLSDVALGYLPSSQYPGTGLIDADSSLIVEIKVYNNSDQDVTILFGTVYGLTNGGELILENDKTFLEKYITYMKAFTGYDDDSTFHHETYQEKIKSISFVTSVDTTGAVTFWDMSEEQDASVLAWVTDHEEDGYYHLFIGSLKQIYAKDLSYFFYGMKGVDEISFDNLYTKDTESMLSMFEQMGENSTILTLDLGDHFDTSNVTNMERMFFKTGYSSTEFTLNLGANFNTSKVVGSMYAMFCETGYNSTVFTLNLGDSFDTSGVTAMNWMFGKTGYSSSVFTLILGDNFDTSNVLDMTWMFGYLGYSNSNFALDLGNKFNTSSATSMAAMFYATGYNSTSFSIDFGNLFTTSNVTSMGWMFGAIGKATTNLELDLSSFDFSNVTTYTGLFDEFSTSKKIYVANSTQQAWIVDKGFANVTSDNVIVKS